ncbi:MAG: NUDIX domain-containing protein [Dongiaceae bacterium]
MTLAHRLLGVAARLYWRVARPRTLGVRALVLDPDDRIVLVRHVGGRLWGLPGGGVRKGEGFAAALARELGEELAIAGFAVERLLGAYHSRREGKDDHILVLVVRLDAAAAAAVRVADGWEIAAAEWFALDRLPELLSPATGRRIAEYRRAATGTGAW